MGIESQGNPIVNLHPLRVGDRDLGELNFPMVVRF